MADNHRELVQRFVDMINAHDVSTMSEHTAPGHIDHNPVVEDGIEANTAFWEQIFAAFPDVKVVTHDLVVEGDRIAGRFGIWAPRGTFFGVEATGRPLNFQSIDFWRVEENRLLAEHWDQLDMAGLFRQLGVDIHAGQDGR